MHASKGWKLALGLSICDRHLGPLWYHEGAIHILFIIMLAQHGLQSACSLFLMCNPKTWIFWSRQTLLNAIESERQYFEPNTHVLPLCLMKQRYPFYSFPLLPNIQPELHLNRYQLARRQGECKAAWTVPMWWMQAPRNHIEGSPQLRKKMYRALKKCKLSCMCVFTHE